MVNHRSPPRPLRGLGVLVTRPAHQAALLCQAIEDQGGIAIRYPTLTISEPADWQPALAAFAQLAHYDLALFTSPNAVAGALPRLQKHGHFPSTLEMAAIGRATARALIDAGIRCDLQPATDFTSEGLLALPRFHKVAGQSILIVSGEGGRTLLAETLAERGAQVTRVAVYRRERPATDINAFEAHWTRGEIGAVAITSTESFINLFDMLDGAGQDHLRNTPLIVLSARTQQTAAEYGCRLILVAKEASDDAIVAALLRLVATLSSAQFGNAT